MNDMEWNQMKIKCNYMKVDGFRWTEIKWSEIMKWHEMQQDETRWMNAWNEIELHGLI